MTSASGASKDGAVTAVTAGAWTNLYPALNAISVISSDEAWAAGEGGAMLHYSNGTWNQVTLPTTASVDGVEMLSPTLGWAIPTGSFLEYDGVEWSDLSDRLGDFFYLYSIAPVSENDIWGIGRVASPDRKVAHYDGTLWRQVALPISDTAQVLDITMLHADQGYGNEGWAVGQDPQNWQSRVLVLHYDGRANTWTRISGPADTMDLRRAFSSTPGELWAMGLDMSFETRAYHYANGSWTGYDLPGNSDYPGAIYAAGPSDVWTINNAYEIDHWNGASWSTEYSGRILQDLSGAGGQVWAVGYADTVLSRIVGGGGAWSLQRGGPTTQSLNAVSIVSPDEAWAVGDSGTFLHCTGDTCQPVITGFTDTDFYKVQMLSPTDGYALGAYSSAGLPYSTLVHWDGARWAQVATIPESLRALAMTGPGSGWAVGDEGTIWRGVNGVWTTVPSPATVTLYAIAMDSPTHGWAGGYGYVPGRDHMQVLLEYNGTSWVDRSYLLPPSAPDIEDIWLAPGGQEGWAVGSGFYLLHLVNGNTWVKEELSVGTLEEGVAGDALGEVWAVGGITWHRVNGQWEDANLPTNNALLGISVSPGRGGWAVGERGGVLRYNPLWDGRRYYDVPPDSPFYSYIEWMATQGIISGYSDNTFRPNNNITRGQLSKIVVLAEGWAIDTSGGPHFSDVPRGSAFYDYIETAYNHGVISGYSDGTFRWGNNVTRGQLSKIVVNAQSWPPDLTGAPHFSDVAQGSPFYTYVETAYNHGVISGYSDGTFRPQNDATRGQISKIVYNAVTGTVATTGRVG